MPGEHNLRRGNTVLTRNLNDHRVFQNLATLTERRPSLGHNTKLTVHRAHIFLREIRVQLNLVNRRGHAGIGDNFAQLSLRKIRNTNRTHLTLLFQLNERPPRLQVGALLRFSPVNQIQIHVVGAEPL